jgi:quinol monooxygenase YgiN
LRTSAPSQRAHGTFWPEPAAPVAGEDLSAPVQVIIEYSVDPGQQAAFLAAMAGLRRSRLRTGAFRWALYHDPEDPCRYVEQFDVDSWPAHLEQHHDRLTADDRDFQRLVENTARAVEPARHMSRQAIGDGSLLRTTTSSQPSQRRPPPPGSAICREVANEIAARWGRIHTPTTLIEGDLA